METYEDGFTNSRGQRLHYTLMQPKDQQEPVQGLLVFHHGLTEHSARHWHVLEEFVAKLKLVVVTYDAHGHGKSEPLNLEDRAYVEDYRHLRDDMLQMVDEVAIPAAAKREAPKGRVYLAGHSIGGTTCLLAAIARPGFFTGLLLSSPLVCVAPNNSWGEWAQILGLRILNQIIPKRAFLKRRPIHLGMRCQESVAAAANDSLWYKDPLRVRTVIACINVTQFVQANVANIKEPLFIQQGVEDRTCSVIALRRLLPYFSSNNVTYCEVPDGFHDLHHDPETPECIERMVNWLRTSIASPKDL